MKRPSIWFFGLAIAAMGCSTSTNANGSGEGDDVVCANGACDDALADAVGDTQDSVGATDIALNDVTGSEVANGDAADASHLDAAASDAPSSDAVDGQSVEDAAADVVATADGIDDVVPTEDVALDVVPTEDVAADATADAANDAADTLEDVLADDAAADVVDVPDGAVLVDPWSTCGPATATILYASANWIQDFRVHGANIYWTAYAPGSTDHSWVHGMPTTGVPVAGTPATLADSTKTASVGFQGLAADNNGLYFAADGIGALYATTYNADAATVPTQLTAVQNYQVLSANQPRQVAVYDGTVYFAEQEYSGSPYQPGLRQVSAGGGTVTQVAYTPKSAGYPRLNSKGLAYNATPVPADGVLGGIYFLPVGATSANLLGQGAQVIGPDMDDDFAYWSQVGDGKDGVWKAPLAGGAATQLTDLIGANVLAQDPASGNVYFYASKVEGPYLKAAIFKVSKAGGQATAVVCDLPGAVWNIQTDATNVYFSMADGKSMSWTLSPDTLASVAK